MTTPLDEERRAELVARLAALRSRISDVCAGIGRDPRSVTLIAVTKTYPASDVLILSRIGVADIGENRDQEAAAKVMEVRNQLVLMGSGWAPTPRWHFIGQLQSRKCRSVASYASAVHSVDRMELVGRLADGVVRAERGPLDVFVQVSLDRDPDRGGVVVEGVLPLAEAIAQRPELRLRGVMAVAPLEADPDAAFEQLAEASASLRAEHPQADAISAGMTADMEAALRHGSTHVRIGSALLGPRDPLIG